jgi:hypothetical protein
MENLNENVPQVNESSVNDQPVHEPQVNENKGSFDEVKNFYKGDFKNIFTTVFTNPIDGIYNIFKNPSPKAYTQSLILFGSVFAIYLAGFYVILGKIADWTPFSVLIKMSLIPLVLMFSITLLSFIIKSISGKADFKAELLTGGLAGIPVALYMVFLILFKLFGDDNNYMRIIKYPYEAGMFFILIMLYLFLMLINILQQSLKASGNKDAMAWFLSPASIILTFYVTYKVAESLFF